MGAIATRLKQVGRALFACLVLCLAVVPTVDALFCASDATAAESVLAQAGESVAAVSHDHGDKGHGEGGDACVHGHCHQAAAPATALDTQLARADLGAARLAPAVTGLPPSRSPDGPMEPPRA